MSSAVKKQRSFNDKDLLNIRVDSVCIYRGVL
ncbi:hypothetical protein MNBD_GAMMA12-3734 [hydrothermal vent metagenome]|uniref:Uncharacterized protein n=1 Tax=hydrothermal vent metagenome TaxID=652676 RepID=A0A3B0XZS2_9ZZZZ